MGCLSTIISFGNLRLVGTDHWFPSQSQVDSVFNVNVQASEVV